MVVSQSLVLCSVLVTEDLVLSAHVTLTAEDLSCVATDEGCGNCKALSVGVLVDVKLGTILSMPGSAGSQGGSTPGYALKVQISTEKKRETLGWAKF